MLKKSISKGADKNENDDAGNHKVPVLFEYNNTLRVHLMKCIQKKPTRFY
jgi:hypothetical protein